MSGLVLSLFPGLDVLGMGFEQEGYSVVAGPDVVWGRDVREFHVPAGVFEGVVGGPPCQTFSALANLVRAKGLEPRFGNLIPEFVRVVEEAKPKWFLMENVPGVPGDAWPRPMPYNTHTFILKNEELDAGGGFGHEQERKRRFWFGWDRSEPAPDLRSRIQFACFLLPKSSAVLADGRETPVKIGGSGKLKRTVTQASVNNAPEKKGRVASVTGRHTSNGMGRTDVPGAKAGNPPRYTIGEMLRLQGLSETLLDEAPFTAQGKRKLVGNAVPLPMARALAKAIKELT